MKLVSRNYIGISIIITSVVTFIVLLSVSLSYASITHAACGAPTCTLANHIPVQSYIGFGVLILSGGIGSYLTFNQPKSGIIQTIPRTKLNKIIETLHDDEKKIFNELRKNDGSAFQNDLIRSTNYSKVKVSRVLDRLETKGLIERRRRGMTNNIILKV